MCQDSPHIRSLTFNSGFITARFMTEWRSATRGSSGFLLLEDFSAGKWRQKTFFLMYLRNSSLKSQQTREWSQTSVRRQILRHSLDLVDWGTQVVEPPVCVSVSLPEASATHRILRNTGYGGRKLRKEVLCLEIFWDDYISFYYFIYFFETGIHMSRLTLTSWLACPSFPQPGTTGVHHHARLQLLLKAIHKLTLPSILQSMHCWKLSIPTLCSLWEL